MSQKSTKQITRSVPSPPGGKMMSELPYKTLKDISDRLDLLKDGKTAYWREMATMMNYNQITVESFGMQASKPNGSPGYALLLDMSNRGVSYEELVSYLKRLELFDALVQIGYKEDVRITKQPVATPVMCGQKLQLECCAEGVPRPQYLWFQGQTPLENQRGPILEINKVNLDHAGIYTCRAGNTANFVFSQWVEVQVQNVLTNKGPAPSGHNEESPMILEHPAPAVLEVGNKLFLSCQASGPGKLEYQWFVNGKELPYGTKPDLVIKNVQLSDAGVYVCCVKSSNGSSVLTKGAEVIVNQHMTIVPTEQSVTMMGGANTPYGAPYPEPPPGACFSAASMPPQMMDPMNQQFQQTILVPEDGYTQDPRMFAHSPVDASGMPYPQGAVHQPSRNYHDQSHNSTRGPPPPTPSACPIPAPIPAPHPTTRKINPIIDDEASGQDYMIDKPCSDKVALLIGNKNYHVKSLKLNTPENDTQDLAGILRSADFKVVSLVNLTKKEMDDAIEYFTNLLGPNVYALFFFAGHGFELNSMNYMMAVDCTKQKNPAHSVCAQKVLQIMQETRAKLSVVLLDMCRVVAPQSPITDLSEVYKQPYPAKSYPGYHIYGFSCSPAEKAYEVASGGSEEKDSFLGSVGKDNSIFVAALKEHLQHGLGSLEDAVQSLFSATAKGVYKQRPPGVSGHWQRPEISSNLAEDLSLADPIDPTLLPEHQEIRSRIWKDAHTVPEPMVVGSGHLALRLHLEAEHTNVLIIQVEVLQGCLMEAEVERMNVELILQEKPIQLILAGAPPEQEISSGSISLQKSIAKKNLLYFKIPDLQKITSPEVTLHISTNYRWRDSRKEGSMWQFQSDHIYHKMAPPPLYGKITAHEEEQRRMQQQQPHHQDPRLFHHGSI